MNKVNNQELTTVDLNPAIVNEIKIPNSPFGPYRIHTTSLSTGIKIGNTVRKDYIQYNATTIQKGYRLDLADAKNALNVGDVVSIPLSEYTNYQINKVVTPEIDKTTGKYASFQDISDTPIELKNAQATRAYQFDISINISDI